MQLETYNLDKHTNGFYYEFYSEGPKGKIKKVVEFYRYTDLNGEIYNLAFGDWNETDQAINDLSVSNNQDKDKILATIAATVIAFMAQHPNAIIIATGSTMARTRLYQMGITKLWHEIDELFEMLGYTNEEWQPFQKGINYKSFLLTLK